MRESTLIWRILGCMMVVLAVAGMPKAGAALERWLSGQLAIPARHTN